MIDPQPVQDRKELRDLANPLAQLPSSGVGSLNFRSCPAASRHQRGTEGQLQREFPTVSFWRFGQLAQQFERVRVMALGLDHRVARARSLTRYLEVLDRFVPIVGAAEMMR